MRLTKGRIIGGAVTLVLILGTATAWWVAAGARTPAQQAADSTPPADSIITAKAEERELLELLEAEGELQRADELKVTTPSGAGEQGEGEGNSGATLVSKLTKKKGDKVNAGNVLIEINGRPYIALTGKIPAYRDLRQGDQGPDVKQLQQALSPLYGTPVTGTFDGRTAGDVTKLYQNAGYQPVYATEAATGDEDDETAPTSPTKVLTVPQSEIFFAEELPLSIGKVKAKLGAPAEGELMSLVSGKWRVVAEMDDKAVTQWMKLKKSTPITFSEGPLEGKKAGLPEIEEVKTEEGSEEEMWGGEQQAKQIAIFTVSGKIDAEPGEYQGIVAEKIKSPKGSLVVPASAIWTSADGTEKVTVYENGKTRDVVVETHVDYDGEVAITAVDGDLSDGDDVVVAKRDKGRD